MMEAFFKLAILSFLMGLTTVNCMTNEPRCYSRFDWEDKLLEKAIRTEIKVQQCMEKFEAAMEEIKGYKDALEEWKESAELQAKALELTLTNKLQSFADNLTTGQEFVREPVIAFNVRDAKDLSPQRYEIITFSAVILNIGNAYDESTGVFTAPVNGIYIFSVQVATYSSQQGRFQLVVDDRSNVILSIYHYITGTSYSTTSGTVAQRLTAGQRVWVQSQQNSGTTQTLHQDPYYGTNQFSGMLVHKTLD